MMRHSIHAATILVLGISLSACASAPAVKAPTPPRPEPVGTFVGVCGDADPSAPCVHEVPQGWTMMTAGAQAAGADLLMSDSARRSLVVKRHEVTQDEWSWLMDTDPSFFGGCPDCPVERVSWWDTLAYLNRLSVADGFKPCYELRGCTGKPGTGCPSGRPWCESSYTCESVQFAGEQCAGYRLPTSDEWRWVADAMASDPDSVSFPWCADISQGQPRPVTRTLDGTMDGIAGNVWEWTWDTEGDGQLRGHRGGSFRTSPTRCDAAAQSSAEPRLRSYFVGFRPMRTLPLSRPAQLVTPTQDTASAHRRGIVTPASGR